MWLGVGVAYGMLIEEFWFSKSILFSVSAMSTVRVLLVHAPSRVSLSTLTQPRFFGEHMCGPVRCRRGKLIAALPTATLPPHTHARTLHARAQAGLIAPSTGDWAMVLATFYTLIGTIIFATFIVRRPCPCPLAFAIGYSLPCPLALALALALPCPLAAAVCTWPGWLKPVSVAAHYGLVHLVLPPGARPQPTRATEHLHTLATLLARAGLHR